MRDHQPYSLGAWLLPMDEDSIIEEMCLIAKMYSDARADDTTHKIVVQETDWIIIQLLRS